jgi:hypothetical protein
VVRVFRVKAMAWVSDIPETRHGKSCLPEFVPLCTLLIKTRETAKSQKIEERITIDVVGESLNDTGLPGTQGADVFMDSRGVPLWNELEHSSQITALILVQISLLEAFE